MKQASSLIDSIIAGEGLNIHPAGNPGTIPEISAGNGPSCPASQAGAVLPLPDPLTVENIRSTLAGIWRHFGQTMSDASLRELEAILDDLEAGGDLVVIGRRLVDAYRRIDGGYHGCK